MPLNLENPKRFLPMLLFFGCVFVLVGMGWQSITSNPTLTNDGWIVVAIAIVLWIFSKIVGSDDN